MMAKTVSLVIAAGGAGQRFQHSKAGAKSKAKTKLFFELAGKPVLYHSIRAFDSIAEIKEIILTVPKTSVADIRKLTRGWSTHALKVTAGGSTRAESVFNGIKKTNPRHAYVIVHDGARPLVTAAAIKKYIKALSPKQGVLLASPATATVKQTYPGKKVISQTLDRSCLYLAETPQGAPRSVLIQAYRNARGFDATDEASLLESAGFPVKIVTHDTWNPKITTYKDLRLAEAYMNQGSSTITKAGLGQDLHRLVPGRKLYLAGLHIPYNKGALGHSDGDVVLHSVIDAILGVLGAGDIGDWFSDKDKRFKNIRSTKMLPGVLKSAAESGWDLVHVDVVITLQQPKLGSYKIKMKNNLAKLLKLKPEHISIKAKTAEGLGPEGRSEALSCQALVTMKKDEV